MEKQYKINQLSTKRAEYFSGHEFSDFIQNFPYFPIEKTQEIHKQFKNYQQVIQKFYSKINLISHSDLSKIWIRHFIDSLIPIKLFQPVLLNYIYCSLCRERSYARPMARIKAIDIGSGAGFPGVPIAMMLDQVEFLLVESSRKRAVFLEHILLRELALKNVKVANERSETLLRDPSYRESFDFAFTRALAKPPVALELLLPFLKAGGKAFFWASGPEWDEKEKLEKCAVALSGKWLAEKKYILPQDHRKRKIVLIEKIFQSDEKDPRMEGILKKRAINE